MRVVYGTGPIDPSSTVSLSVNTMAARPAADCARSKSGARARARS
jgi:hypothetical protein